MASDMQSRLEGRSSIAVESGLDRPTINPLIHIGYHKTGTSWLQLYLFGRNDRGFVPLAPNKQLDRKKRVKFMGDFFRHDKEKKILSPFETRFEEIRDFLSHLELTGSGVPVISNEGLSGSPHNGGIETKEIANRLAQAFPEARIFIVIREQRSMILSTYFHYLFKGGTWSLQDYIGQPHDNAIPRFSLAYYRYDHLIEHYQSLFGAENTLVMAYEFFCTQPAAFVAELAAFAGANVPSNLEYEEMPNKGLPRVIEYHTRFLNPFAWSTSLNGYSPFAPSRSKRRKKLRRIRGVATRAIPSAMEARFVARLKAEIDDAVTGYYDESNKRTSELTGIDLAALGYM